MLKKELEPNINKDFFLQAMRRQSPANWVDYERAFEEGLVQVRTTMALRMNQGEVLSSRDIQALTQRELNTRSTSRITSQMNKSRRLKGFSDFRVGSGKYRGMRFYFDASLEPGQIDFDGVVRRIDVWKGLKDSAPENHVLSEL